jgi:trehalose 6-phosphate synthase
VANRLPIDLEIGPDGRRRWRASPGGLVTALEPLLRAREGAWVGWPGVADAHAQPFTDGALHLHPVQLSAQDVREYYEGFSNATLWPLYHDVVAPPVFERRWWQRYAEVNQRFADATAQVAANGATVWVQDYQLQLVPAMLREQRPDLKIGFFLHIPFPPTELFLQLPWRRQIVDGLLGADLIGFQMPGGAQNFLYLSRRVARLDPRRGAVGMRERTGEVQVGERLVRVGAFPISIDAGALDALARSKEAARRAEEIRYQLGNPRRIILGIDRLDYTKGIDIRLRALHELYEEQRITCSDVVMVQLATPSRERVEYYRRMRADIELQVGRINGEFSTIGHPAVHYLHQSVPREELVAFYLAADVMLVTPLRDGMNLVCKEYVACRHDLGGALVLSEFAGAAAELTSAFLVNPHDLDGVKETLYEALHIDPAEGRRRMRALRRHVLAFDVDRWARSFLNVLGAGDVAAGAPGDIADADTGDAPHDSATSEEDV